MSLDRQTNFSKAGISQPIKDDWWEMRAHLPPQKHYDELHSKMNSGQFPWAAVDIISNVRLRTNCENYVTD